MKLPGYRRQSKCKVRPCSRRGITFVELLVAGVLLCIGLMALVQAWSFSFRVTAITDDNVIAYNLGRQAMEQAKMDGFNNAVSSVYYYDGNQGNKSATLSSVHRFSVTTTVSGTTLKQVDVTVTLVGTGQALYQTHTYLVRAGI
jgi:Tfp pilus assembly protein PilV